MPVLPRVVQMALHSLNTHLRMMRVAPLVTPGTGPGVPYVCGVLTVSHSSGTRTLKLDVRFPDSAKCDASVEIVRPLIHETVAIGIMWDDRPPAGASTIVRTGYGDFVGTFRREEIPVPAWYIEWQSNFTPTSKLIKPGGSGGGDEGGSHNGPFGPGSGMRWFP